jgi:hypothetical protein
MVKYPCDSWLRIAEIAANGMPGNCEAASGTESSSFLEASPKDLKVADDGVLQEPVGRKFRCRLVVRIELDLPYRIEHVAEIITRS